MALVVLADDAYAFMVMWETMALSSFFLVTANHRIAEIRRAGYLYLLDRAHRRDRASCCASACCRPTPATTPSPTCARRQLSPFWASIAFLLALFGFGAKAGMLPLHVWLPEAHPAAPSPVSALMSGVMLKTAIYGLLRVTFDLLPAQLWWWGGVLLALGLATALFGVVFAAVQVDMKRLLAYSSIENIGLLFAGIGLARPLLRLRHEADGGAGADGGAVPRRQPRALQEPALPRHRLRCCMRPASATSASSAA